MRDKKLKELQDRVNKESAMRAECYHAAFLLPRWVLAAACEPRKSEGASPWLVGNLPTQNPVPATRNGQYRDASDKEPRRASDTSLAGTRRAEVG